MYRLALVLLAAPLLLAACSSGANHAAKTATSSVATVAPATTQIAATPTGSPTVLPGALATAPKVVPSLPPSPSPSPTVTAVASAAPPLSTPVARSTLPPTETASPSDGHAYFASRAPGSDTIYCDTDPGWQKLDPATRVSFLSLADALAVLPKYHLNKPC
jgi:hypothetical protein